MAYVSYRLTDKTEYMTGSYILAERYATQRHKRTSAVISIHSAINRTNPKIFCNEENQIKDVLFLCFEEGYYSGFGMSEEDAKAVADFVFKWVDIIDLLIVHCDGGVARSPGVCAAIAEFFGGEYERFFNHYRMKPDTLSYQKTLAALQKKSNDSDTMYLSSVPGMKEKIIEGMNTALEECIPEKDVLL